MIRRIFFGAAMFLRQAILLVLVSVVTPEALSGSRSFVVVPVKRSPGVDAAASAVFYQAILNSLNESKDLRIVERAQLKLILDEIDLASALNTKAGNSKYAAAAAKLSADQVLIPGVCKLESDYFLSLGRVSVAEGVTEGFVVRKTRLSSRFSECAKAMVEELVSLKAGEHVRARPESGSWVAIDQLRERCRQAGAEALLPTMWKRTEAIKSKTKDANRTAGLTSYYMALLHDSVRAANPPEGMVFIPGGSVSINYSKPTRLWVEPFFVDRAEVSVGEYNRFLAALRANSKTPNNGSKFRPITRKDPRFNGKAMPVTGISFYAAEAYATWRGKRLPTVHEWLRAANTAEVSDDYPCGDLAAARKANLYGVEDGHAVLAPAANPGRDVSTFGVHGLTGNVREWTSTWHRPNVHPRESRRIPREPADGTMKVVKGGSWRTRPDSALRNHREIHKPKEAFDDVGFRCAIPFYPLRKK